MDKHKADWVERVLSFANTDLEKLTKRQCEVQVRKIKKLGEVSRVILVPLDKKHRGGTLSGAIPSTMSDKEMLKDVQKRLKGFLYGWHSGRQDGDLGEMKLNVSVHDADFWRLVLTPNIKRQEHDLCLWRLQVGMGWALHGMPVGRIKRCARCDGFFLQKTKKRKDYCTRSCVVRSLDDRRKETEHRKQQQRQAQERAYQKKVAQRLGTQPDRIMKKAVPEKKRQRWVIRPAGQS